MSSGSRATSSPVWWCDVSVELKDLHFEPDKAAPQVTLLNGYNLPGSVASLDFQERGVLVESFESGGGDTVRHLAFVPYGAIRTIEQGYIV